MRRLRSSQLAWILTAFLIATPIGLVLSVTTSGCATTPSQARHNLVVADTALYQSAEAFRATVRELHQAGIVTDSQFQSINQRLVPIYEGGRDLTKVLQAWQPGDPWPVQIARIASALADLVLEIKGLPDGAPRAQLLEAVTTLQVDVVKVTGGGL